MRSIRRIILHHTATPVKVLTWEQIRENHMDVRGWRDIGYHRGIVNDHGFWQVVDGRPIEQEGAHARGANNDSIGIAVEGNYQIGEVPEKAVTQLVDLVWELVQKYKITVPQIIPHREVPNAHTLCPGHYFPIERIKGTMRDRWRNKIP